MHLSEGLGLCVKQGAAHEVVADGRRLTYPADGVCLRPPGCVWQSQAGRHGFVSLDLPAELVDDAGVRWSGLPMSFADARATPWAARRIAEVMSADSTLAVEEASLDLVTDLVDAGVISVLGRGRSASRTVRRAREHLHEHLHLRPTLADAARAAGTDRFSLLRGFRAELGTTPHAYLVQARLTRAQQLLARGQAISTVAAECGFADQAHLGRWFRKLYGITPATYAAQVRPAISFQTVPAVGWHRGRHDHIHAGRPDPSY